MNKVDAQPERAALILNGETVPDTISAAFIACADGGYNLLRARGIVPDVLIGDMDSVTPAALRDAENRGVRLLKFNVDKNETDGELALRYLSEKYSRIDIYGAFGGRRDHEAANLSLLPLAHELEATAVIRGADCDVHFASACGGEAARFAVKADGREIVSIVPLTVMTLADSHGLQYDLSGLVLRPGSTRGISNIATQNEIGFTLLSGSGYIYITA
ncbi:MAG: thiamine diphosphokinase [Clostridiales bacterium]|nr:thiamine diphosphokinase [Clostridiales bacterium]